MGVAVLQARLIESREIAPETRHFVFDVPEVEQLPYAPGQFVSFSGTFKEKKITRALKWVNAWSWRTQRRAGAVIIASANSRISATI